MLSLSGKRLPRNGAPRNERKGKNKNKRPRRQIKLSKNMGRGRESLGGNPMRMTGTIVMMKKMSIMRRPTSLRTSILASLGRGN